MTTVTFQPQRLRLAASQLEVERQRTVPELPSALSGAWQGSESPPVLADPAVAETIKGLFPATYGVPTVSLGSGAAINPAKGLKVGVVLSGGQAPGGHNVVAGIYDAVKRSGPGAVTYGFCDGPHGLFSGNVTKIDDIMMNGYRNTGGFDMIGSGRHKIESPEQFVASREVCEKLELDGLVIIGGDDSNTNGALLAEEFKKVGCATKVIGCPKTIDGDLKCPPEIPVSFGFDTACRTYAELVGNVALDALTTQKYYHFCRLMGRSASNIALEVALLTNPNMCLLGEEVSENALSLKKVTEQVVNMILKRSKAGKNYGTVLLPEGLIEFIPEFNDLMKDLNELGDGMKEDEVLRKLSKENQERWHFLPEFIRAQLLLDRDPHGNVQVAKIETEKLLAGCVEKELERLRFAGEYQGSFTPQYHAFGYEGRAGLPSRFDATYCYCLGYTAAVLIAGGKTGLLASVKNLTKPVSEWQCGGVPVTALCVVERRKGKDKPVIKKAVVNLSGTMCQPFHAWAAIRDRVAIEDYYRAPGPLQFDASCPVSLDLPITLCLELGGEAPGLGPPKTQPKVFGSFLYCPRKLNSRSKLQQWRAELVAKKIQETEQAGVKVACVGLPTRPSLRYDEDVMKSVLPTTFGAPLVEVKMGSLPESTGAPPRIGVVFCGRQAPGGHDALIGVVDAIKERSGEVLGFVGGTGGLLKGFAEPISDIVDQYRATGGFDLLGRLQDRIETEEERAGVLASCSKLNLDGLVMVGGTRTASDTVHLAEYFAAKKSKTSVVFIPCGIEGSLINPFVEMSLGFDTASKVIAQLVANTSTDGASARKYYYFLRLMDGGTQGKESTSHVTMEVALSTRPNMALFGEYVAAKSIGLREIVSKVADVICARAEDGKNFGTVILPEGFLSSVPECRLLLEEIAKLPMPCTVAEAFEHLSEFSGALLSSFPSQIQQQLLLSRMDNGEVHASQVAAEQLLAYLVEIELKGRKANPESSPGRKNKSYKGSFSPVCQFLGYQVRCGMPSDFDCEYGRVLGSIAAVLAASGHNGYLASVSGLAGPSDTWRCAGVPLSAICSTTDTGVRVVPAPLKLQSPVWFAWSKLQARCAVEDLYQNPGPIQLSGPSATRKAETLIAANSQYGEAANYVKTLEELGKKLEMLRRACRPGCDASFAKVANRTLSGIEELVAMVSEGPLA
eukprot:CAMPEP_0170595746 /NCGR_PEP_ID=MMETSP0224-20130122/14730_1 /TAXON_ID=285029 /ORGANISM="Togula jolla, Strain CCCM 725" /LENGTH=1184 /DNA_ID=CAMNT_0010919955 /DNA_START=16 /DNA_END=3570 /DNA_ORIENTATION=+